MSNTDGSRPGNKISFTRLNPGRLLGAIVAVTVVLASFDALYSQTTVRSYRPVRVLDQQPAIRDVPTIPGTEVDRQVAGSDLVIGVVANEAARAYPINMLTGPRREIMNDSLGGRAIAATW